MRIKLFLFRENVIMILLIYARNNMKFIFRAMWL